jgi:hypothetical protein
MADASEDLLLPTAMGKPAPHHGGSDDPRAARDDEAEDGDEVVDYRFLAALAASSAGQQGKIPSRGIKDFEPHGTQLQSATLDASRDAMHAVLREERAHRGDASVAVWDPEGGGSWVVHATGKWAVGVGRSRRVAVGDGDAEEGGGKQKSVARLYLLPEETLWLVERGTIDLRWPSGDGKVDGEGLPMSLQAAHAMLLGKQKPDGLTLEKFTVYQYLKRAGYNVERAEDNWDNVPSGGRWALLGQLLRVASKTMGSGPAVARGAGPLVTPGLYRDYSKILPRLETELTQVRVHISPRLHHPLPLAARHTRPDQPVHETIRDHRHHYLPRLQAHRALPQDRPRPTGLLRQRRRRQHARPPDRGRPRGPAAPDAVCAARRRGVRVREPARRVQERRARRRGPRDRELPAHRGRRVRMPPAVGAGAAEAAAGKAAGGEEFAAEDEQVKARDRIVMIALMDDIILSRKRPR